MAHKIIKMNSLMFFQACLNVDHHQIEYLGFIETQGNISGENLRFINLFWK